MVGNLKGVYSDPFEVMPMLKRGKVLASDDQESRSVLKIFTIAMMQFTLADNGRRTLHARPKGVHGEAYRKVNIVLHIIVQGTFLG